MEEKKKGRGRPSGKKSENPDFFTITDPLMEPFYITKDSYNFTLIEKSKATRGFGGKKASNKEVEKVVGYYTSFKHALKKVATEKFQRKHKNYSSIQEYINGWKKTEQGLENLLNQTNL